MQIINARKIRHFLIYNHNVLETSIKFNSCSGNYVYKTVNGYYYKLITCTGERKRISAFEYDNF